MYQPKSCIYICIYRLLYGFGKSLPKNLKKYYSNRDDINRIIIIIVSDGEAETE